MREYSLQVWFVLNERTGTESITIITVYYTLYYIRMIELVYSNIPTICDTNTEFRKVIVIWVRRNNINVASLL